MKDPTPEEYLTMKDRSAVSLKDPTPEEYREHFTRSTDSEHLRQALEQAHEVIRALAHLVRAQQANVEDPKPLMR